MKHQIFVYGLLRKGTHHPMSMYLEAQARHLGTATFHGNLFLVNPYPGAIPSESEDKLVIGDVFEFDQDEVLYALDDFEEVGTAYPDPNEYVREFREVNLDNGNILKAWIYLYNHPTENLKEIKSGDFLNFSH